LPGTWILVRGNHDGRTHWLEQRGFALVVNEFVRSHVLYTHIPRVPLPEEYKLNVHGHLHEPGHRLEEMGPYYHQHPERYLLVSIEQTLAPVPLDDLLRGHI
jgi:metallophosphoesterase superfamily enzyme